MSSQTPPDPITTGFNPEAWEEPTGLLSKLRALVHYYVTYPIAQNYPITFSNLVFITDATLTKMANTSYVFANLVAYLASLPPLSITWSAIQNFTGIETNTVNPIGGTLTIGNTAVDTNIEIATRNGRTVVLHLGDGPNSTGDIHIGNGLGSTNPIQLLHAGNNGSSGVVNLGTATSTTNLRCPLTPLYNFPVGTATGNNTPSIGRAGTIGFIAPTTFLFFGTGGGTNGSGISQRSVSLTAGTWLVAGTARTNGFAGSNAITFTTQQNNTLPGPIYGRKGTWQYANGQPTYPWGLASMAIVNLSATTTLYLSIRNDNAISVDYNNFTCIRIA